MGYNVESCLFNAKVIFCFAYTDLNLTRQVTVEVLLIQLVLCHCQNAGTAAEPSKSLGTRLREMTFLNFASLEYDGNVYMTPDDFLESIIDDKPRCKPGSFIFSDILCACVLGLPPIPFLSGYPIFGPSVPCPIIILARMPLIQFFSVTPCWVHIIQLGMVMCGNLPGNLPGAAAPVPKTLQNE